MFLGIIYLRDVTGAMTSFAPIDSQVIDDMVFAIGGFNGVTTIFNVECYDPQSDEW